MSTDEIRRLALELDPIVWVNEPFEWRLSGIVADDGWAEAEADYPEVRRFLDRLSAMVDRLHTEREFAWKSAEAIDAMHKARIEKARGLLQDGPHGRVSWGDIRWMSIAVLAGEEEK